jgi:aryl carrier-like protein
VSIPQDSAQRDVLETVLVHCWESTLRHEPIGVHDNFFALGGHSLFAMRIANRLRKAFGVPLDYVLVLERPTIAALAQSLRDSGLPAAELDRAGREYLLTHGLPVPDPR